MSDKQIQTRPHSTKPDAIADVKGDVRELTTPYIIEKLQALPRKFSLARESFEKELRFRADKWNDIIAKGYFAS